MKAIKSFEVMESFGMKDLSNAEMMDVDGGFDCICKGLSILPCTCKMGGYIEPCKCKSSTYNEYPKPIAC